ncbi:NADH-quinone oxidoreductase subunit A [Komagataeibacter xylinus]|uniref:NADH-quinone oxidoreductase subunit A n=1 Tax=Komagataeibacter xylinus TaxID=28448 RepID=UPI00280BC105|nr:NADH-quinone oxidoreductase subunit A [Komagataeibacter xylinus]
METMYNIWSVFSYAIVIGILLAGMLGLSSITGTQRTGGSMGRSMSQPFESGIVPTGSAHLRLPVQYYLAAIFFVIFDVETAILLTWATVVTQTGWIGYTAALIFTVFLVISLVYLWRAGALDWGPRVHLRQVTDTQKDHV